MTLSNTQVSFAPQKPPSSWTYDWQADSKHGIEIGQRYRAIGEAIDGHFKTLYHPPYNKHSNKGSMKGWYLHDWKADRDHGMAIANNFKDLGEKISKHYKKFRLPSNTTGNTTKFAPEQWEEYKEMGEDLAVYYRDKGVAIARYYKGRYGAMSQVDESSVTQTESETDPVAIQDAMKEKGMAIAAFYRARYDATFRPEPSKVPRFPPVNATGKEWAPWGIDPTEDKAHGKAIGKYFRQQGQEIGQNYQTRGKELGAYYEDYYRSMFDPTYVAPADLN